MSYVRTELVIKDVKDFSFKIDYVFEKWQIRNFDYKYLEWLQDKWIFSSHVFNLMTLVKAKASSSPEDYELKEKKMFEEFENWSKATMDFFTQIRIQKDAFRLVGKKAESAEYQCPKCGGDATAFRTPAGIDWNCPTCEAVNKVQEVA